LYSEAKAMSELKANVAAMQAAGDDADAEAKVKAAMEAEKYL
jgi:hypothetical protein